MRFGRQRKPASDPPEMAVEFTEAVADIEAQIRDIVDRLESAAHSAGQVVLRARRSRDAAQRAKGGDGGRAL